MPDRETVDISGLSKAAVLAVLWNHSAPAGMGFLQAALGPKDGMTEEAAWEIIKANVDPDYPGPRTMRGSNLSFEYLFGRPLKIDLVENEFDPWGYDRDNGGDGTAQRIINQLRETGEVNPPEAQAGHRSKVILNAHRAMEMVNTVSTLEKGGGVAIFHLGADELAEPLEKAIDTVVDRVESS
ncbi:MAG: hypothetical protein PHV43_01735 [Candidatus Colwellbacteria bacterium]|nr:hypothetical protein [Candidatus Colwellbacteria bacterium]